MKRFSGFSLILAAILCLSAAVVAQDQRTISVEKKKLIAELLVLTKAEQQVVEITDKMLESMQTAYPAIVAGLLERNSQVPDEAKAGLQEAMLASFQSFSEKFRQRLPIEIDYRQFVEDLIYPLYDQFFSEKELADLITFYKTETGQKVISELPQLFAESMKLSQQYLLPKVIDLTDRIIKEEFDQLKNGPPPPVKN